MSQLNLDVREAYYVERALEYYMRALANDEVDVRCRTTEAEEASRAREMVHEFLMEEIVGRCEFPGCTGFADHDHGNRFFGDDRDLSY